jgi:hypothetical protein
MRGTEERGSLVSRDHLLEAERGRDAPALGGEGECGERAGSWEIRMEI